MDQVALTGRAAEPPIDPCCDQCRDHGHNSPGVGDDGWVRAARRARQLAWVSLVWMTAEGAVGLAAGLAAGSVALTGWSLGSAIEAAASVIVIWRFTGSRVSSEAREQQAARAVAVSGSKAGRLVSQRSTVSCSSRAASVRRPTP